MMKPLGRILSVDDSPLVPGRRKVLCVGVISNGSEVEGMISFHVRRDGLDATRKLVQAVTKSRFAKHVRLVLTHSVTLAGLNILDLNKISGELKVPVIALTKRRPARGIESAVRAARFPRMTTNKKLALISKAGQMHNYGSVYFHAAGTNASQATKILGGFNGYPWPLRFAHLIASAIVVGESHGRA